MHPAVVLTALLLISSCSALVDEQEEKEKEEEIQKIFEESVSEGRFFHFDRANAFNTSVAFTIPLFSFILPGSQDSVNSGLDDGNTFGVLAFVALFLLAALAVAIFTTSQGGNAIGEEGRGLYSSYFETEEANTLTARVLTAIHELPNAIDVKSCYYLSVCQAHAHPAEYGALGQVVRWSSRIGKSKSNKSKIEKAAEYGATSEDECYYEYPCLVEPLDSLLFLKNAANKKIASMFSK